jgi:peptidoglycan/xylan/chitin deacetylase (PgdA/CDA1 family)
MTEVLTTGLNTLPLLDSFGAKATFYISSYHMLSSQQKNQLREIKNHGHEIGLPYDVS